MAQRKIKALTTFLHGKKRFEEGKTYTVSLEEASYFAGVGWAESTTGRQLVPNDSIDEPVTLEVHDGEIQQSTPSVGVKSNG